MTLILSGSNQKIGESLSLTSQRGIFSITEVVTPFGAQDIAGQRDKPSCRQF
jgi:hypothetical protein